MYVCYNSLYSFRLSSRYGFAVAVSIPVAQLQFTNVEFKDFSSNHWICNDASKHALLSVCLSVLIAIFDVPLGSINLFEYLRNFGVTIFTTSRFTAMWYEDLKVVLV